MAEGVKIKILGDDTDYKKVLASVGSTAQSSLSGIGSAIGSATSQGLSLVKRAAEVTVASVTAVSTALITAGTQVVKFGSEFEQSAAKASTLFGDVNVNTDNLNKKMLELSSSTGVAANELNEGLYSALSAGVPVTQDMSDATAFLGSSAKLAKSGFTDVDTAISATAKTLNAYGMNVTEANKIQGILIQTQNKGITTVNELGASLAQVTPTAAAFGVSFEQVGASLATMTAQGTPTAQATTQLNSLIAELGKSGTVAAKNLEKAAEGSKYAGMSFNEMMQKGATLDEILLMMESSAKDSGVTLVDMFSSIEAGKSALSLVSGEGEVFKNNLLAMNDTAGLVDDAYDKVTNTFQGNSAKIKETLKNLGISIFNENQEILTYETKFIADLVGELQKAYDEDGLDGFVSKIGEILSKIVTNFSAYIPIVIDLAVELIQSFIGGFFSQTSELANVGIQIITSLLNSFNITNEFLLLGVSLILDLMDGLISTMPDLLNQGTQLISDFAMIIVNSLPLLVEKGEALLSSLVMGICNNSEELISSFIDIIFVLVDSIGNSADTFIFYGTVLLENLITGLLEKAPDILQTIIGVISSLSDTILTCLPTIIELGMSLLMSLINGIVQLLPMLLDTGLKAIVELALGISQSLPELIPTLLDLMISICDTLLDNLPMLLTAALDLIIGLAMGLMAALPQLIVYIPNIIIGIVDALIKNLGKIIECAIVLIVALAEGLVSAIPTLINYIPIIVGSIIAAFLKTNWIQVGMDIIKGIANGVVNSGKALIDAIKRVCKQALNSAKDFFGIKSPSRLMRDVVGKQIPLGMAVGIDEEADTVEDSMVDMSANAFKKFKSKSINVDFKTSMQGFKSNITNVFSGFIPQLATTATGVNRTESIQTINNNTTQTVRIVADKSKIFNVIQEEDERRGDRL